MCLTANLLVVIVMFFSEDDGSDLPHGSVKFILLLPGTRNVTHFPYCLSFLPLFSPYFMCHDLLL
jgi:hypothetical protein